jgi:hypothetical protein
MATSKAASAVYASGEDPGAVAANRAYQDALAKLTESLDQRKNRFFDPVWLAAAKGFLSPGSPNTFESLGRVAGNIAQAQEGLIKEDQDIAQQRLELAGRGVELQRQKSKDAMVRRILAGEDISSPAAPPSGALPSAGGAPVKPQGALAQAQGVERPEFGIQVAPAMPGVSRQQYLAAAISDGKSVADALKDWDAIQRGRRAVKEGMIFDSDTGVMYPGSFDMVETQLFGYPGKTFQIPKADAFQLSQFVRNNDEEGYRKLAKRLVEGFSGASAPSAPSAAPPASSAPPAAAAVTGQPAAPVAGTTAAKPAAPAQGAGVMSKEELAAKAERDKAIQASQTQIEVENRKDFFQRSKDADESITTANMLRRFSEDPNASKMVGILNDDKISSGIAKLVKEGVGTRDYRIGVPAIEEVMRNAGLSPADQAKYRVFLMNTAMMRLQMSKYMKGSVSNYEQELMGEAAVSAQDTKDTIRMKADLLTKRAQFDRKVNKAFKASKMTAEEFLDSEQYEKMRDEYNEQLAGISVGALRYQSGAATPAAAPQAGGAARPATAGAGQPSPGFIRDPQTGMIRRKRPGE